MANSGTTDSVATIISPELVEIPAGVTHTESEFVVGRVEALILELEDVLFHYNSAVMMPCGPAGRSSKDGIEDDRRDREDRKTRKAQEKVTGIEALALVYKELEIDPRFRLLIVGHTDTSGKPEYNFKLSKQRAKNVLYLLIGPRKKWAQISAARHRIEDYQQIMFYFHKRNSWNCNPRGIDNRWGPRTETAILNFFKEILGSEERAKKEILNEVKNSKDKKWPEEAWSHVYDLYSEVLCSVLRISNSDLDRLRTAIENDQFVDEKIKFLACGESYPIDDAEKLNYRSQRNRRVEILFFDQDRLPNLDCQKDKTNVHTIPDCPIWGRFGIKRTYVDAEELAWDLHAVVYHLKFQYYDLVKCQTVNVPEIENMTINVFRSDNELIDTRHIYREGTYIVVAQFKSTKEATEWFEDVYFTFHLNRRWLFTEDKDSDPTPVELSDRDVLQLDAVQRWHHYDLPPHWDSRNWPYKYNGRDLEFSLTNSQTTSLATPMVFNLDIIVLYDIPVDQPNATQDIKDEDHNRPANVKDLQVGSSRVKLFTINKTTAKPELYKRFSANGSSRIPFPINRITENINDVRIVFFRNGFYTVGHHRSRIETDWETKNFLVGARAAVRNDDDYHFHRDMHHSNNHESSTGDYELHYFHHIYTYETRPISYLFIFVSIDFMRYFFFENSKVDETYIIPSPAALEKFLDVGIYKAMDCWNSKLYYFEQDGSPTDSTIIIPFYFFNENETFQVKLENLLPDVIDYDRNNHENFDDLINHAAVQDARDEAFGGRPKYLTIVFRDIRGKAYHWSGRGGTYDFSLLRLNQSAYEGYADYKIYTEDSIDYSFFTFAHELGHATGNADEYVNTFKVWYLDNNGKKDDFHVPSFEQYYECYSMTANESSMMNSNRAPRMHHLYYYLHFLQNHINITGGISAKNWLAGTTFVIRHDFKNNHYIYRRDITSLPIENDMCRPFPFLESRYELNPGLPLKRLYLALYYVSQDESSARHFHDGQTSESIEYQAVLMVRLLLSMELSVVLSINRAYKVYQLVQGWNSLSCKYRLVGGHGDIENIIIHFLIGLSNELEPDQRHYRVTLLNRPHPISVSPTINDEILVGTDVSPKELGAFFLNIADPNDLDDNTKMVNVLNFLRTWINFHTHDTYALEFVPKSS
jgi:hypothetical protein